MKHIKVITERLDAWIDTHQQLVRTLPDSETEPHKNAIENYEHLKLVLEIAQSEWDRDMAAKDNAVKAMQEAVSYLHAAYCGGKGCTVLDKPEDLLWHAEDNTWWRRNTERNLVGVPRSDALHLLASKNPSYLTYKEDKCESENS